MLWGVSFFSFFWKCARIKTAPFFFFFLGGLCRDDASGEIIPWDRLSDNCIGSQECGDTCDCVTAYAAGLESYVEAEWFEYAELGLVFVVLFLLMLAFVSKCYGRRLLPVGNTKYCKIRDDLQIYSYFGFLFQLWDFWSDLLLNQNMYDHFVKVCQH